MASAGGSPIDVFDVNVSLGAWPFQYFREDSARALAARLEAEGISGALVGSPEAAFNPDMKQANRLLVKRLAGRKNLVPLPAVDPTVADWHDLLKEAQDTGARAVKVLPGYHGYRLDSREALTAVETIAATGRLALVVQLRIEDERTHHPLCRIPAVSAAEVTSIARRFPELPVIALCAYTHELPALIKNRPNVYVDLAFVETMRTLPSVLSRIPSDHLLFGSHTPFMYTRASLLKLLAPGVDESDRRRVASGNARQLLALRAVKTSVKAARNGR